MYEMVESVSSCPDQCGLVGSASTHKAKGHHSDSRSGHKPGLRVLLLVGGVQEATD